jgi:hypothetical protein
MKALIKAACNPTTDRSRNRATPAQRAPADQRLIAAIVELDDPFAVCGLKRPIAILLAPG